MLFNSHNGLCITFFICLLNFMGMVTRVQNSIVKGQKLCDPQVRVYDNHVFYATHDDSVENTKFVMHDWWICSSPDLVKWKYESGQELVEETLEMINDAWRKIKLKNYMYENQLETN